MPGAWDSTPEQSGDPTTPTAERCPWQLSRAFVWVRAFRGRDRGWRTKGPANKPRLRAREPPAPLHTAMNERGTEEEGKRRHPSRRQDLPRGRAGGASLSLDLDPPPGTERIEASEPAGSVLRAGHKWRCRALSPGAGWANPSARPRPHRTPRAARILPAHLLDVHVCGGWGRPATLSFSLPSPFLSGPSARLDRGSPPPPPAPSAAPRSPRRARSPLTQTKWRRTLPVSSRREPFSATWRENCGAENALLYRRRGDTAWNSGNFLFPIFSSASVVFWRALPGGEGRPLCLPGAGIPPGRREKWFLRRGAGWAPKASWGERSGGRRAPLGGAVGGALRGRLRGRSNTRPVWSPGFPSRI